MCARTAEANGHTCLLGNIRELIKEDPKCTFITKYTKLKPSEPFAIVGGPPCQPFSMAGKRLGTNDPKGILFMKFLHVIKVFEPRFFVMKNVKGLLSTKFSSKNEVGQLNIFGQLEMDFENTGVSAFDVILNSFKSLGYKIVYGVLDAVHFGVPQFRERLIIIGSRDHENIFLPKTTHFQIHQDPQFQWRTPRDAIEDLEDNPGPCASF